MTLKKPLTLSIVIPVYNEQHHLKRCLDAIAVQSVMPDTVIVVDNNSTDKSASVAKKYPFVKVINEPTQGIVHARNTGFNAVKSDLIGRIDADTILPPDWVERVHYFYSKNENCKKALTGGGYFYNLRLPKLNGWLLSQLAYRLNWLLSRHYILWGSNMVLPMTVWLSTRSKTCTRQDIHEDVDLAIHTFQEGFDIVYDNKLLVGVKLKRVWSERASKRAHMNRWPRTFKVHGYKLWWFGTIGNIFLNVICEPFFFVAEMVARLFRHRRIVY